MKYFIMLMVFCLCMVSAQDAVTFDPKAEIIVQGAEAFAANYLDANSNFLTTINELAQDVALDDATSEHFQTADYLSQLNAKVLSTLNLANFQDSQYANIRQDYLNQVADFCMVEYLRDMKDGITQVPHQSYLDDIDTVRRSKENEISDIQNPPESVNMYYNPNEYLDRPFGVTDRGTLSVIWGGVNDNVSNSLLVNLIDRIRVRYASNSYARSDFSDLTDNFPQNDALGVMANSSDPNIYNTTGTVGQSFQISQYGHVVGQTAYAGSNASTVFPAAGDGTYNNRSYGYRYTNGTYTTFKMEINGREYSLQETIFTSPLVFDMDGDGKLEASKNQHLPHLYNGGMVVEFDMVGDGFLDLTEWVGPNDGLLVVDNHGEEISANNLFGTAGGFNHGYEKLSLFDKNKNGEISGEELVGLNVWQDKNSNAKVDKGEMQSLQEAGITSISLNHSSEMISSFVQNGVTKKMWDWYPNVFRVKRKK